MNLIFISVFGVLGVLSRYSLDILFLNKNQLLPTQTILANFLGCLIAGVLYSLITEKFGNTQLWNLAIIGFCGGLTTFSSFALQAFQSIEQGHLLKAYGYLLLFPIIGLFGIYIGMKSTILLLNK
jgi:CrcB protein